MRDINILGLVFGMNGSYLRRSATTLVRKKPAAYIIQFHVG